MDDVDELSRHLWVLREQLEQLACALDVQQLILANGRLRWLGMVTENIEQLVDDIKATDRSRTDVSRRLCLRHGLPDGATLTELADVVGEPWSTTWMQHRLHLIALQSEIEEASASNHELARRGVATTRDMLVAIDGDQLDVYSPGGSSQSLLASTPRLDRTV